jgi:phage I-like protein
MIALKSPVAGQQLPIDRHFAWELFSAGPAVKLNGKKLNEVPVAVRGTWVKDGRRFSITDQDLQNMVGNFDKRKNEMLVIDYEHASEQPQVAQGGPVPAAGWIHSLFVDAGSRSGVGNGRVRQEELLKALVEWTPEAKQLIDSGQYRFFSPSIDWGARDKLTGEPQGATLTSGALTNHPFLEELPPLMLTDLTAVPGGAGEKGETTTGPEAESGQGENNMEVKRLSIRKLSEGPQAGHHGVFYGDELVGYMTDEDFLKYVQKHLPAALPATDAGLSELFAERVGASGAALEDVRELIEAGRRAQAREGEASSRALILSEVVRDGRVRAERAIELARDQKITLADYVAVQAAETAIDRAAAEGKILPRDRHFFFRDALERPREFAEFVERATPVVRLGSEGIGSGEAVPVDQEVDLGARRVMSEQKVSYGKALKLLFRENPALEARYREAHSRRLDTPGSEAEAGADITQ